MKKSANACGDDGYMCNNDDRLLCVDKSSTIKKFTTFVFDCKSIRLH